ncbi:muscarinic acetylcholine receptor M2-like [Saccoglossus kowalevskii]|uniref:Probable muscarinic acetylcholine receptor gar-2-like n=1 Tax=Saccoglossus kowalevskii TaxID=10224 RepID=A0ABM0H0W1_SACKO|nr:PREDICTED: probable muscarinic acetylcholine receptor gar-2-like [Saccoglossus kowalevskii]
MNLNNSSLVGNDTSGLPDLHLPPHNPVALIFICVGAAAGIVFTAGGNVLVLESFRIERRLHKPSNYFLFSLACADLMIGLVSMPLYSVYVTVGYWPLGNLVCDLWLALDYACCTVSVMNLLLISSDRLWSVSRPASYRNKMTLRRATLMIIPTWIIPFVGFFTAVIGWPYFSGITRPAEICQVPYMDDAIFMTVSTVVVYWLPLLVLILIYLQIFRIIQQLAARKRSAKSKQQSCIVRVDNLKPHPASSSSSGVKASNSSSYDMAEDRPHRSDSASCSSKTKFLSPSNTSNDLSMRKGLTEAESFEMEPSEDTSSSGRRTNLEPSTHMAYETSTQIAYNENHNEMDKEQHRLTDSNSKRGRKYRWTNRHKSSKSRQDKTERADKKAMKTLTLILGAFFVTWSPYSTFFIIMGWCAKCIDPGLYSFSYWLCYMNSTLNPLCYAFANELFRVTFIKILTCNRCRN